MHWFEKFPEEAVKQTLQKLSQHLEIQIELLHEEISVFANDKKIVLPIVLVPTLNAQNVHAAIHSLATKTSNKIIFAQNIPKKVMREMRTAKLNVFDLTGKIFVKKNGVYIYSEESLFKDKVARKTGPLAFNASGIKIIYACLCLPDLIKEDYRKICEYSGTSLGSVNRVFNELIRAGFIVKKQNGSRVLTQKKELFDRWCIGYAETLRPKLIMGRYTSDNPDWWKTVKLAQYGAIWGGEVAANLVTQHLKPEIITLYSEKPLPRLQLDEKLRNDSRGKIEILSKFWKFPDNEKSDIISPYLLIYADLISTGDDRNAEIAAEIKDKFLKELFS